MKNVLEKVRRMDDWQDDKIGRHGYKKNKRGERKLNLCSDSSDSPEIPYRVKTSDISGIPTSRKDRILREEHEDQATTAVTTSIPTTTVAKQKQ